MTTNLPDVLDALVKLVLAAALGGLIGFERDKHGRAAGLRTHLLVSMGAAVFMILSRHVAAQTSGSGYIADPGRIAAQIVAGIGFLGAGVILKTGHHVRGLTTAACLWTAAGVGMAAGGGFYAIAGATTALALLSLVLLKVLERRYAKDSYRVLSVVTSLDVTASDVIAAVKRADVTVISCDIRRDYMAQTATTRLSIRIYHRGITDKLAHGIVASLDASAMDLREVSWGQS
ncbi:MAG: MgtC/SapB family protein [Candidatus Krumholzibacteriia bacterium]